MALKQWVEPMIKTKDQRDPFLTVTAGVLIRELVPLIPSFLWRVGRGRGLEKGLRITPHSPPPPHLIPRNILLATSPLTKGCLSLSFVRLRSSSCFRFFPAQNVLEFLVNRGRNVSGKWGNCVLMRLQQLHIETLLIIIIINFFFCFFYNFVIK